MLKSDQEIAEEDLHASLKKLARKHKISVQHVYSIIDTWMLTLRKHLTDEKLPEVRIDNFIIFTPRPYKLLREITKLWVVYRKGNKDAQPKDPKVISKIKLKIAILRRLKLEKTGIIQIKE